MQRVGCIFTGASCEIPREVHVKRESSVCCSAELLIFVVLGVACQANAQDRERFPERVIVSETATATCYDSTGRRLVGSMLVRSPVFVSPDGRHQAFVENEAVAYPGRGPECVNNAKLFVKGPGDKEFRLAYLQEPTTYQLYSHIEIVDWSPDSRDLLVQLFIGQWGSDWGAFSPLLYHAWDGVFSSQNMVSTALSTHFGYGCSYGVRTLGFSPDGGVVLKIQPVFDEEGALDPKSCVKKQGLWLLKDGLLPLASTYGVRRYGEYLAERVKR